MLRFLLNATAAERKKLSESLTPTERNNWHHDWDLWCHPGQRTPGGDWRIWLIMAGRGFGKTRAGAEWARRVAENDSQARIALIAASLNDARSVMVEGESGILACCAHDAMPKFEPSLRRLTFPNGAEATIYSAGEPETLRGPQHSHAWCDEIGKWSNTHGRAMRCWDNLMMGLRLGEQQQIATTTTPRSTPLMRRLMDQEDGHSVVVSRGTTYDNAINLPDQFLRTMETEYGNSVLARQELNGELIDDIEGALWTRSLLESCRETGKLADRNRVVIGVDPPASATGDACGIVVVGLCDDGIARVLADASIENASPEAWAQRVADTWRAWSADRIIAEANQGGAMVESVLRAAEINLPVKLVHASRGKAARAEPVAALYEAGRVRHHGTFAQLEDELCGLMAGGEYQGPGRSPDRADALVWALTELMLSGRGAPNIRRIN